MNQVLPFIIQYFMYKSPSPHFFHSSVLQFVHSKTKSRKHSENSQGHQSDQTLQDKLIEKSQKDKKNKSKNNACLFCNLYFQQRNGCKLLCFVRCNLLLICPEEEKILISGCISSSRNPQKGRIKSSEFGLYENVILTLS